ncbi:alkaline phosphatase [Clostridium carboxidivorans P7]|uniref:Sulfatase n=1 Tax=Clostridium carboxidivorans P7 TaxID=536227 RepID=C6Q1X9_9CLOT|nr:LTA synthase family protein [Clostridium carboxidivorans]AKN33713.1 alkaline phosphatase [Clostridium carboxidivorans P7]EET84496.1 sulfatase [Clostridium carboxidivorans P7]EFG86688.1 arylsulfatase [Clostridium carboxidivorans P7]
MKKAKVLISTYIDVILFIILVCAKALIYGRQLESGYFSYTSLLYPIFASIIILVSFSLILNSKIRTKFLYICNLIITIFLISDLNYFRYFKDVISIPVLINGFQLGAVKSSVSSIIKFTDFFYALDLIFIPIIINKYKSEKAEITTKLSKALIFSVLLIVGIIIDTHNFYSLSKDQPKLLTTMYNKVYITKKLGSINYHYLDFYNFISFNISRKSPVSKSEETSIQTFFQDNSSHNNNLNGAAKGKNLIMIQVEALQEFVINAKVDDKEITPNLNKWIKRSEYFNNFYYQISAGGTSDAEFMTNNSLYPASSGAAYFLYCGNEFNAMPKSFKKSGYNTAALHGFRESFWNRNVVYKKFGFDNFYGEKSYNIDENVGLGLSDKSFLNQSIDKIKKLDKPYYSFLITLSSHFPYDDVDNYGNFNVGSYENSLLGNYLKSIHYTDEQLGIFFDKLEKEGILKDSVVVLYGDHYAIPKEHEQELCKFLGKNSLSDIEWLKLQKVPMMIHFPDESIKGVNNIYSGQMDIYPTIANLFNLSDKNFMGKDLFNSSEGNIIFRDGSFIYNNYYYVSQKNSYYNISTNQKIDETDALKKKKEDVLNQLQYSDEILKHNLLKKFKSN